MITLDDKYKALANRVQDIAQNDTVTIGGQQTITITKDQIINAKNIKLNGGAGVITCQSICPFTGKPHVDGSSTVLRGSNMALSKTALKAKIITEMQKVDMVTEGQFAKAADLAEAIANAVVDEITVNAMVVIDKGSSIGKYKVY